MQREETGMPDAMMFRSTNDRCFSGEPMSKMRRRGKTGTCKSDGWESRRTLSNETSNPDHVDPALWERLRATADPLERGTGSHLDYPLGAQTGVDGARSTGSTSQPRREPN
jgi:hypothetical protein